MENRKKDYYKTLFPVTKLALDYKYPRTVTGEAFIPEQPALYVANHIHAVDSMLVAASVTEQTGKPIRFGAKQEYFDGKGVDNNGKFGRTALWLMEHTWQIPVDRNGKDPRGFQKLTNAIGEAIERGDSVALHPEGTRSTDGKLHKFQLGAARIALDLDIPLVPVGLVYTDRENSKKVDVGVNFGQPIMPEEYHHRPYLGLPGRVKAEMLIQTAENRVSDLTGMPQSGMFAFRKPKRPVDPQE